MLKKALAKKDKVVVANFLLLLQQLLLQTPLHSSFPSDSDHPVNPYDAEGGSHHSVPDGSTGKDEVLEVLEKTLALTDSLQVDL